MVAAFGKQPGLPSAPGRREKAGVGGTLRTFPLNRGVVRPLRGPEVLLNCRGLAPGALVIVFGACGAGSSDVAGSMTQHPDGGGEGGLNTIGLCADDHCVCLPEAGSCSGGKAKAC